MKKMLVEYEQVDKGDGFGCSGCCFDVDNLGCTCPPQNDDACVCNGATYVWKVVGVKKE